MNNLSSVCEIQQNIVNSSYYVMTFIMILWLISPANQMNKIEINQTRGGPNLRSVWMAKL